MLNLVSAEYKQKTRNEIAAEIFQRAASYIRTYGWQVSGMSEDGKPRCSMGALESASPTVKWDEQLSSLMYNTLYHELGGETLTEFNHRVQNGESVAKLFEHVAHVLLNPTAKSSLKN